MEIREDGGGIAGEIIVNLRTNCTKESFDPVFSIAKLPFFK